MRKSLAGWAVPGGGKRRQAGGKGLVRKIPYASGARVSPSPHQRGGIPVCLGQAAHPGSQGLQDSGPG
jgi:hypothetical protein